MLFQFALKLSYSCLSITLGEQIIWVYIDFGMLEALVKSVAFLKQSISWTLQFAGKLENLCDVSCVQVF